jgi:hypothetical protein
MESSLSDGTGLQTVLAYLLIRITPRTLNDEWRKSRDLRRKSWGQFKGMSTV